MTNLGPKHNTTETDYGITIYIVKQLALITDHTKMVKILTS